MNPLTVKKRAANLSTSVVSGKPEPTDPYELSRVNEHLEDAGRSASPLKASSLCLAGPAPESKIPGGDNYRAMGMNGQ